MELHISHTQPGLQDDPRYGATQKVVRWRLLQDKGEFQMSVPYQGVYPGRFKLFVRATVDHAGKTRPSCGTRSSRCREATILPTTTEGMVRANGQLLCTKQTPVIRVLSSATLELSHTPQAPGPLSFKVLVNPDDRIGEVNESNNQASAGLAVHVPGMQRWRR